MSVGTFLAIVGARLLGAIGGPIASFVLLREFGPPWDQPLYQMPFGEDLTLLTVSLIILSGLPVVFAFNWLVGIVLVRVGAMPQDKLRDLVMFVDSPNDRKEGDRSRSRPIDRPWWILLKIRMRTLMAFVVVFALGLALLLNSARDESAVVATLESKGAKAWLGWRFKTDGVVGVEWPRLKSWEDFLGVGAVAGVRLLVAPSATDDDMVHVSRLSSLTALDLSGASITDVGLANLRLHSDLYAMYLDGTAVSDKGLSTLLSLKHLHVLSLRRTRVVDATSVLMMDLKDLEFLSFRETAVGDDGLDRLTDLPNLDALILAKTQVTDAGLRQLKRLKKLTVLSLADTKVTDVGLRALKEIPQMELVSLKGTAVTDAGVAELQRARPKLRIVR